MKPIFTSPAPDAGTQHPTSHRRVVAIAGNPNSGKSTLFNALTGLSQKVGNYPGVTVDKKTGRQFVVVVAGGARDNPKDRETNIVAFALPEKAAAKR